MDYFRGFSTIFAGVPRTTLRVVSFSATLSAFFQRDKSVHLVCSQAGESAWARFRVSRRARASDRRHETGISVFRGLAEASPRRAVPLHQKRIGRDRTRGWDSIQRNTLSGIHGRRSQMVQITNSSDHKWFRSQMVHITNGSDHTLCGSTVEGRHET